jgi:hypothetical protein
LTDLTSYLKRFISAASERPTVTSSDALPGQQQPLPS